jgi:hypothetical protein
MSVAKHSQAGGNMQRNSSEEYGESENYEGQRKREWLLSSSTKYSKPFPEFLYASNGGDDCGKRIGLIADITGMRSRIPTGSSSFSLTFIYSS